MPMIFEALRSRARSAEATALDTIAAAARTVAAGGTANVPQDGDMHYPAPLAVALVLAVGAGR